MNSPPPRLRAGDNVVYLLDRERVTDEELDIFGDTDPVLSRMIGEWLAGYAARFFLTVARNFQPIIGSEAGTFDAHDDSILFLDKAALLSQTSALARGSPGYVWVILATQDVEDAVRAALTAFKPN